VTLWLYVIIHTGSILFHSPKSSFKKLVFIKKLIMVKGKMWRNNFLFFNYFEMFLLILFYRIFSLNSQNCYLWFANKVKVIWPVDLQSKGFWIYNFVNYRVEIVSKAWRTLQICQLSRVDSFKTLVSIVVNFRTPLFSEV